MHARVIYYIFIQPVLEIILANMAIRELITDLNLSKNVESILAEGASVVLLCVVILPVTLA